MNIDNNEKLLLLVEDNEINMLLMQEALSLHKYPVVYAEDGRQALQLFTQKKPSLILMDIQLPDMDGADVLKEIRKTPEGEVPVIALTAFAMKGDEEKYLGEGFDGYVSKPVNIDELMKKIESLLEQ